VALAVGEVGGQELPTLVFARPARRASFRPLLEAQKLAEAQPFGGRVVPPVHAVVLETGLRTEPYRCAISLRLDPSAGSPELVQKCAGLHQVHRVEPFRGPAADAPVTALAPSSLTPRLYRNYTMTRAD
jgi:hypothetical protein